MTAQLSSSEVLTIAGNHLNSSITDDDVMVIQTFGNSSVIPTFDGVILNKFKNLQKISIFNAKVERITADAFMSCSSLEHLELVNNLLVDLPSNFLQNCKKLQSIGLSMNKIGRLQADLLTGADNLEEFYMSFNAVPLTISDNLFAPISNLKTLYMTGNSFQYFPTNILRNQQSFMWLCLENNNLTDFNMIKEIISSTSKVETLWIGYNKFTSIDFQFLRQRLDLVALDLTNMPILKIPANAFPSSLNILNLQNTELSELNEFAFSGLKNLSILILSSNLLEELPKNIFNDLINLNILWHNNCKIKQLDRDVFKQNTKLFTLRLENNAIGALPEGIFTDLQKLISFQLSGNKIRRLNKNSFGKHEGINFFYISSNEMDEIEPGFFENFPALQTFDGQKNLCVDKFFAKGDNINDFNSDEAFNECYQNWENPRTTPGRGERITGVFSGIILALIMQKFM